MSVSSSSYLRFHIQSSIPKSHPNFVPLISSKTSLKINFPSLRCCSSPSSLAEHDQSPSTRIFIKGLSLSTTKGDLKKEFSKFGEVNRVKILTVKRCRQSLGFAYLWFTDEESVNLAVNEMNGKFFEGRFVYVTTAKSGPSKVRIKTTPYKF